MGNIAWIFILGFFVLYQGASLAANIWLSEWTDDSTLANISMAGTKEYNDLNALYLGVYGGLGAVQGQPLYLTSPSSPPTTLLGNYRMAREKESLCMHSCLFSVLSSSVFSFFEGLFLWVRCEKITYLYAVFVHVSIVMILVS